MKYSKLLSRIGAVMDRLVEMGFEQCGFDEFYHKTNKIYIWFYKDHIDLYYENVLYSEKNWEEKLFDKLKEMGIE